MVCIDEVFVWFKSLKGSKRIEFLCGLLNMCCPWELRFCCSCLEELASRDFVRFKDDEVRSNSLEGILNFRDIRDPCKRSNLILSLSLLQSSNSACSAAIFKILKDEVRIEGLGPSFSDPKFRDEIFLLLTLARNHPAFTFDQQTFLGELIQAIESHVQQYYNYPEEVENVPGICNLFSAINLMPSVFIPDLCNNRQISHHNQACETERNSAQITNLKVKGTHKKTYLKIRVSLNSGKGIDVYKTPNEIVVFHQNLMKMFPREMHQLNDKIHLPNGINISGKYEGGLTDGLISSISDYVWQLHSCLPSHITQSEFVHNFFLSAVQPSLAKASPNSEAFSLEYPSKNSRLPTFTFYNTQHIPSGTPPGLIRQGLSHSSTITLENENCVQPDIPVSLPHSNSPLNSPVNSPFASPSNSETNSRSGSPWAHQRMGVDVSAGVFEPECCPVDKLLAKEHLQDYSDILKPYGIDQLQMMSQEELECILMHKDNSSKLKKLLENSRIVGGPANGISNHIINRNPFPPTQGPLRNVLPLQNGNTSSICSDYSSSSESPSPLEIGNNSASSSSSEEIGVEKGTSLKPLPEGTKLEDSLEFSIPEPQPPSKPDGPNYVRSPKELNSHYSVSSVMHYPVTYTMPHMSPIQAQKPSFLPLNCRSNAAMHMSPGAIFIDQFSRVQLPSALTFLSHVSSSPLNQRPQERTTNIPQPNLCPTTPIVTSGSFTTVPVATSSFATNKSSNITMVTNSLAYTGNHVRHLPKCVPMINENAESLVKCMQHPENFAGYVMNSSLEARPNNSACTCHSVANLVRMSPPVSTNQQPASMPYAALPYVVHQIPFAPNGTANGFIPPPTIPGHSFYALSNGMMAINPEIFYGQPFPGPQSVSQAPPFVSAPNSQSYSNFQQTGIINTMPVKITCYNCGKAGHRGPDCKEQSFDDISNLGKFQLNYAISSKPAVESNN